MGKKDSQILSREQLLRNYSEYILVRGFLKALYMSEEEIYEKWPGCVRVFTVSDMYDGYGHTEEITQEFCMQKKAFFSEVYKCFSDDLSRKSMKAFLQAKVESDSNVLLPYIVRPQYFFTSAPWQPEKEDILLDGGAYDGDSIIDFIEWSKGTYTKIIACEPDLENVKCLNDNLREKEIKNVDVVCKGLYKEHAILYFESSGNVMSKLSSEGKTKLEVDSIDNISTGERVSIIKMDIEGSEMDALKGAEETIRRWRPILMISAYHKCDDIYQIFQFVQKTVDNYKFYFRCHKPLPVDAVLYAVPEERIVRKQ